jgi:tRNA pseudouridine65 synthase
MIPLPILYRDEFLVAIDKPPGMIVHPGRDPVDLEWIAMKRLRDQLGQRVFPVHRLDRPTSGVLLFALDSHTAGLVQADFAWRKVSKTYQAVVCGEAPERWVCDSPLQAEPEAKWLSAQSIFTRLRVTGEAAFPAEPSLILSLVQVIPTTGRYHQIRRHLLEADLPVVGDFRYAGIERSTELCKLLGIGTRMMLRSVSLELKHPQSGGSLKIETGKDPDFSRLFPNIH